MPKYRTQRKNINRHTDAGARELAASVARDGWIGAVTVAADGETFDGSKCLEIGGESFDDAIVVETDGTKPVVVKRTDIPSADDERAVRLGFTANQIAAMDWNPDADRLREALQNDPVAKAIAEQDERLRKLLGVQAQKQSGGIYFDGNAGLQYRVIIDCASEQQQRQLLERFEGEGLTCRALMS